MITRDDTLKILQMIALGDLPMLADKEQIVYDGLLKIWGSGIIIWFYVDCGELDYVDRICMNGQIAEYDDLYCEDTHADPCDLLTAAEMKALEEVTGLSRIRG